MNNAIRVQFTIIGEDRYFYAFWAPHLPPITIGDKIETYNRGKAYNFIVLDIKKYMGSGADEATLMLLVKEDSSFDDKHQSSLVFK